MAYNHYTKVGPWVPGETNFEPEHATHIEEGVEGNEQNVNIINYSLANEWQEGYLYSEFDLVQHNGLFYYCTYDMKEWCERRGLDPIEWVDEHNTIESQAQFWKLTDNGDIGWIASTAIRNAGKALDDNRATQKSLEVTNRSLDALWKLNEGQTYEWDEDSAIARTKTVPSGAVTGSLAMLGGMSRKCRNLYVGSPIFDETWENYSEWQEESETYMGMPVRSRAKAWGGIYQPITVEKDKTYTFSVFVKATTGDRVSIYMSGGTSGMAEYSQRYPSTSWSRYSLTFTATASGTVHLRVEPNTDGNKTYVCGYQLELGSTATDFEPYTDSLIDAKVDKITSVGKNWLNPTLQTTTLNGVTCTRVNNEDGSLKHYILNGTATAWVDFTLTSFSLAELKKLSGFKLLGIKEYLNNNFGLRLVQFNSSFQNIKTVWQRGNDNAIISDIRDDGVHNYLYLSIASGIALNNVIVKPMITKDLTATYEDFVPYREPITTILPPTIIAKCPDYGIGVNENCFNYIDMEEKKYYHNVGKVKLTDIGWERYSSWYQCRFWEAKAPSDNFENLVALCSKYPIDKWSGSGDKTIAMSSNNYLGIADSDCPDLNSLFNAIEGHMLYYELATKEVIDLSDVWSDGMEMLEVESGGTIAFHYPQLDEGYEVDMPNTEIYAIKLQEVR